MRRFLFIIMLIVFLLISFSVSYAEEISIPTDATGSTNHFLLMNGDTIHVLWRKTETYEANFTMEMDGETITNTRPETAVTAGCYELNSEHELVPCTSGCASILDDNCGVFPWSEYPFRPNGIVISAQNTTYAIMKDYQVYQWTPTQDNAWEYIGKLGLSEDEINNTNFEWYAINNHILYAGLVPNSYFDKFAKQENCDLLAFDLVTGSKQLLCSYPYIGKLSIGYDNTILFNGYITNSGGDKLFSLNLANKEVTLLCEGARYGISDYYIPNGQGGWYAGSLEGICAMDAKGNHTVLVDLPKTDVSRDISLSNDKQTIIFLHGKSLHLIPVPASAIPAQANTLRISLPHDDERLNNFLPSDNDFRVQHPGVSVRQDYLPPDETAQSLITGSDTYDLLIIDPLFTDFSAMLEKGYYTDLSDIPEVADYMARLYPVWTAECTHNGQLAALPVGVMSGFSLEYNKLIWEEEALGDVPTTYEELFDFVEQWMNSDLATTYPLFGPMKDTFGLLLDRLLSDYISLGERQGELLPFHDERLLNLLARLESLRPQLERLEMQYNSGDPLFYENGSVTFLSHLVVATQITDYASMPLALWQDATPVVPASLYVMVINPRSTKQDLAKDYLVNITQHPTTTTQCVLLQGQPQGIPYSAADQANMEAQMEEIKVEIALAQSEHDPDRELALEQNLSDLTRSYLQSWDIMPNAAAKLYAVTPYWAILHKQGYGFIQRNASPLLKAYQDNQLSAETLTRRIDQLIEMERMEDQ